MTDMVDYMAAMLQAVADFLAAEPIVYLYSLILLCFIIKIIRDLTR